MRFEHDLEPRILPIGLNDFAEQRIRRRFDTRPVGAEQENHTLVIRDVQRVDRIRILCQAIDGGRTRDHLQIGRAAQLDVDVPTDLGPDRIRSATHHRPAIGTPRPGHGRHTMVDGEDGDARFACPRDELVARMPFMRGDDEHDIGLPGQIILDRLAGIAIGFRDLVHPFKSTWDEPIRCPADSVPQKISQSMEQRIPRREGTRKRSIPAYVEDVLVACGITRLQHRAHMLDVNRMFAGEDEQTHAIPRLAVAPPDHKHAVTAWGGAGSG